ncbi:hypothetical protein PP7435_CHR3-0513 [Komagataella phaffii CBS 7435]|uniref:GTP 3',8-cyclase n=2 Tax=Komagataella phaffii TaxID=460519 RepID=C4R5A0_KOMPG|nr:Hypothetical protein PAS_chr3_0687 [Komagataella phaffii GS115]AOA64110.1 GQ67_03776T0 [Komagataella phaffii]CAH2449487.1 hypothetical protein BQ9382_C3-2741 [Komagataella phaffii CBS 7435]AOA68652.1 GQ68_03748T0 [Komagataella phaffii GS115]CAY70736.1 Hypothetical protein PAS_chr3_0687 [Komagataella phaffii GS115]SCV12210.1 hypothetical protein PP7435_CHR3-0513 [Komagataella phaffii CBS 7435]
MFFNRIILAKRFTHRLASASPRLQNLRSLPLKPFSEFLTDTHGRKHNYLRISITERCNLRCVYCMPEEGVELTPSEETLTSDEIIRIVKLFASQGVTKIRLTGGEPTVRTDIVDLVQSIKQVPGIKEICMTSNGLALHRKLPALIRNGGLTSLNLSLDTLVEGKFLLITRRNGLSAVLKSINKALELGVPKLKINVVIMKGVNEDELLNFVALARDNQIEVRFIEYMPFDGNKWSNNKMITYQDMLDNIRVSYPSIRRIAHKPGDTAKLFEIPGFLGTIGFITSMTENFCSSCTRLRITNDGNLKTCLFGNDELDLKTLLREGTSDKRMLEAIGAAVKLKKASHAGLGDLENMPNRPMILIGG